MKPHDLGLFAACLEQDVDTSDYEFSKGAARGLSSQPGADGLGRQIAGLARDIFVEAGHGGDFEAHLFDQLAKTASWDSVHFEILEPVYAALGGFYQRECAAARAGEFDILIKAATGPLSVAGALISKGMGGLSAVPGAVFGTAAIGGAGLGTLGWALNRQAGGDDADAVALQAKIDHYETLRKEIADELRRNPPPEMRKAMRNTLQKAENPGYAL